MSLHDLLVYEHTNKLPVNSYLIMPGWFRNNENLPLRKAGVGWYTTQPMDIKEVIVSPGYQPDPDSAWPGVPSRPAVRGWVSDSLPGYVLLLEEYDTNRLHAYKSANLR